MIYRPDGPGDPMEDVGTIIIANLILCGVLFIVIVVKIIYDLI